MDILQYLIELLKTRKQVGIEGLGTLYKKKIPGRYDAATHSFLPPSYVLEFTADILEQTNLAQFIHQKRGISEDAAAYFIGQFVAEVQKSLQTGEYQLDHLGTLHQTDGVITFRQNQDIDTGFEFFALPSVVADFPTPNQQKIVEDEPQETVKDEPEVQPQHDVIEPEIEKVQVPEFEQEMNLVAQEVANSTASEEEITTTQESEPLDNEFTEEDVEVESINPIEEEQAAEVEPPQTTENEATDEEVFEEINEVDPQIFQEVSDHKAEDKEEWNFDDESVVIAEDLEEEELKNIKVSDDVLTVVADQNQTEDAFKLTSTTKDWDFDTANTYRKEPTVDPVDDFDPNEQSSDDEKTKTPLYLKLGIALLLVIVAIAITYFIKPELFSNFYKSDVNPDQKMAIPVQSNNLKTQQDSLSFADSIMKNAEKVGLKVEPAKDTIKVTTSKTEAKPALTYDIIVTSFATEAMAQRYIASMKKKGFDAKISAMPGKRKNISIANYNNIDSAEKDVIKFRKQFKNPEIYIQQIKNN